MRKWYVLTTSSVYLVYVVARLGELEGEKGLSSLRGKYVFKFILTRFYLISASPFFEDFPFLHVSR